MSPLVGAAFFGLAFCSGSLLSFGALLVEERAFQRYRRWRCFGRLMLAAAIENIGYRQWYALIRVRATWAQLRGRELRWGEMKRAGFSPASAPSKS